MASITVNGSNSGQTISGDSNIITVEAGSFAVLANGDSNRISGGTGPNTYRVQGDNNGITVGSGGGTFTTTGNTNLVSAISGSVTGTMQGDSGTFNGGNNLIQLRVVGFNNSVLLPSTNTSANVYLLQGDGIVLNGGAGAETIASVGNNVLTGRGGADTFALVAGDVVFGSADTNAARIQDFTAGTDRIAVQISANPIYSASLASLGLSPQTFLTASQFATGAAATSSSTRFVYNPANGELRFTPFGNAATATDLVATLGTNLGLTAASIFISNTSDGLVPAGASAGATGSPLDTVAGGNPFQTENKDYQVITGTPGNDTFQDTPYSSIYAGNLYVGLGGTDTLVINETFRGDTARVTSNGDAVLTHRGHVDAVRDVDQISFIDGRLVFDTTDPAARVVRMYQAGLGRNPDQEGLNFWTSQVQGGATLGRVASDFLNSPEFVSRFGTGLPNDQFVTRIYLNVLGRAPEQSGFDFWVGRLSAGESRQEVLAGIAESNENQARTASLVQGGIWDINEGAAQVARMYDTVLGRVPDTAGLAYWTGSINSGQQTLQNMADQFVGSSEFQQVYGSLGNREFVETIYRNTLDRAGDAGGIDYWTTQLNQGTSRAQVVTGFSESAEHQVLTAANIRSETPSQYGILAT